MDDEADRRRDERPSEPGAAPASADAASADSEVDALFEDWLAADTAADVPAPAGGDGAEPGEPVAPSTATLLDALARDAVEAAPDAALDAPSAPEAATAARRFVLFTIAGTAYAVPEQFVTEVGRVPKITPVPRVPAWLRGVTSLRGEVVSVIDSRILLGLEPSSLHNGRLLVVRLLDEEFSAGLVVDEVDQIAAMADADVKPPASPLEGALAPYLTGVGQVRNRLVAVLDLEALLRSADIRQFEDRRDAEPAA